MQNKVLIKPFLDALADFSKEQVWQQMQTLFTPECHVKMCHPWGEMKGPKAFFENCYLPLQESLPDLERRDFILMSGTCDHGHEWVGCSGNFMGTFVKPWLNIPPIGHLTYMRYHEFYRFENQQIVEVQAIWDIPEVMMQANAWPMAPALGKMFCIPAPASQNGLSIKTDSTRAQQSKQIVLDMLQNLVKHPSQGGPEVMQLEHFWHPKMNWYGPAGVGTCRGISGFRHWHQIPFLAAMPDRGQADESLIFNFFADGDYAAVTGWPNMKQTIQYDGWLGIAPSGQEITLCSLDFWRMEGDKIRENWVLFDLLDIHHQLGVDVLARMREFNKVRLQSSISFPIGDC